jgi:hypothetical protein
VLRTSDPDWNQSFSMHGETSDHPAVHTLSPSIAHDVTCAVSC